MLKQAGASAVAIHARYVQGWLRTHFSRYTSDKPKSRPRWNELKTVRALVDKSFPLIGNGGIDSREDATSMVAVTGAPLLPHSLLKSQELMLLW